MSGQVQQHRATSILHRLRTKAFSIPADEATFQKRGFYASTPEVQKHLEKVGQNFLFGYHAALDDEPVEDLAGRLCQTDHDFQGFAFEGAAMALSFLDRFSLGRSRRRIGEFLRGPGAPHVYMIHVGVGWALARIPWGMRRGVDRLDPLLRWLAVDGYGFHEGFFHFRRYAGGRKMPRIASGYWLRAFDQGFGRSLWFVMGASATKIAENIAAFDDSRRPDLWSGVGLAATYAGGGDEGNLLALRSLCAGYLPHTGQGAAFAVKARLRAGNPTDRMRLACETLCGMSASEADALVDSAMENLPYGEMIPGYEIWRRRIQSQIRTEIGVGIGASDTEENAP